MIPRVFVTEDHPRFDLRALEPYGRKITIFDRSRFADEIDQRINWMVGRAQSVYDRYQISSYDCVALIGDPINIAVACLVLGSRRLPSIRLLKYDRREQQYYETVASLPVHGSDLPTPYPGGLLYHTKR